MKYSQKEGTSLPSPFQFFFFFNSEETLQTCHLHMTRYKLAKTITKNCLWLANSQLLKVVTATVLGSGLGNLGTEYLSSEHRPVLITIPQRSNFCSYFPVLSFVKNCCLNCCTREKMTAKVDPNLKWKKIAAMVYHFLVLSGFLLVLRQSFILYINIVTHTHTHVPTCRHLQTKAIF